MSDCDTVKFAKGVILNEADALKEMAENLPGDFVDVVNLILANKSRVIISGIGKSGHVGKKISATLASTGTPSFFVHAAEASHGDLGMINPDDVCIAISNSGETTELSDVIAHTRRLSIPLVAISKKAESTLAKASDYLLLLPAHIEACPIRLAPTTSTTLTLALGDALAVALMRQRGFRQEQFRTFHPGGKLGAQLALVSQIMHVGEMVPLVDHDAPMEKVLLEMTAKGFGTAGVMQQGALVGVISDGDLRRHMSNLMSLRAADIATLNPATVPSKALAAAALATMNEKNITTLFVVEDDGKPVGVIHMHDLLRTGVA